MGRRAGRNTTHEALAFKSGEDRARSTRGNGMEPDATGIRELDEMDEFHQPTAMFDKGELIGELAELQVEVAPEVTVDGLSTAEATWGRAVAGGVEAGSTETARDVKLAGSGVEVLAEMVVAAAAATNGLLARVKVALRLPLGMRTQPGPAKSVFE